MRIIFLISALSAATLLAYRNTLHGQFIYDDKPIIVRNLLIRDLHHIPLILGTTYWGTNIGQPKEFKGGLYRPLTVLTFAFNYWAGGLNPYGYHLVNVVLHLGVSLLLGVLGLRLGFPRHTAFAAA